MIAPNSGAALGSPRSHPRGCGDGVDVRNEPPLGHGHAGSFHDLHGRRIDRAQAIHDEAHRDLKGGLRTVEMSGPAELGTGIPSLGQELCHPG
jgi:hypothetical protein